MPVAMLDCNPHPAFNEKIKDLIDRRLAVEQLDVPPRNYPGASPLGVSCSRALQDDSPQVPRDKPVSGQTLRIFERGHALEKMAVNGLRLEGFAVEMTYPALWRCKSMNAKSRKQTVEKELSPGKPIYVVQSAVYQAYREKTIPVMAQNPALVTAINKDTCWQDRCRKESLYCPHLHSLHSPFSKRTGLILMMPRRNS